MLPSLLPLPASFFKVLPFPQNLTVFTASASTSLVVNDITERGVKLGYDFLLSARKEHSYQNILQIVENYLHRNSNQKL